MSDAHDDKDDRKGGWAVGCIAIAVGLFPVYVLSIGPFAWLVDNGYLPGEAGIIYLPLAPLFWYCKPFDQLLQWYLKFWQ